MTCDKFSCSAKAVELVTSPVTQEHGHSLTESHVSFMQQVSDLHKLFTRD